MISGQINLFSLMMMKNGIDEDIELFKSRQVKAKDIFIILEIDKPLAYDFVRQYHYLGNAEFFAKYAFGLWLDGELVGVAAYSNPQGITAMKGWFGLENDDQSVLELTRLCMLPALNQTNATSYLLSNSMRMLHKFHDVRAVITLTDASRHIGSIYQVCNFKYYGMANDKSDFYRWPDGKKNPRGEVSVLDGVWIPRTKKHRYAYIMDKHLKCLYTEQSAPKAKGTIPRFCCGGEHRVFDNRKGQWYSCPICTGKLIKEEGENNGRSQVDKDSD